MSSSTNLFDIVKQLQSGTAGCIDEADVKNSMFMLSRMYYPYIPFYMSMAIMKAEFPLNWRLLKAVANGAKFKNMYKKISKDDNIIALYKKKSDLNLKHASNVCEFLLTDLKTLEELAKDKDNLKEIQYIDEQFDKMLSTDKET